MAQLRTRINRLSWDIRRLGPVFAWSFVTGSVAISIYLYLTLSDASRFRDRFITRKYEGSSSEDLGFLAALTTEASKEFTFTSEREKLITEQIRRDLTELKYYLGELKPLPPELSFPSGLSPEKIDDQGTLLRLLNDPALHTLSITDLGLSAKSAEGFGLPGRFYLQTAARQPSSFVFIPVPLVEVRNAETDLSLLVKKDEDPNGKPLETYLTEESLNEYHQLKPSPTGGFEFSGSIQRSDGSTSPVIITSAHLAGSARQMLILILSAELELTIAKKFLHIFSHALKTPVHSIVLIADLFRRPKAFSKFDYYFSLMQAKIREFSVLVEDVLRFSELDIKNIEPHLRPVNVAQVLRKALSAAHESADKKGLLLNYNIPDNLSVNVDAEMLQVVFNNLIDNALKYTERGGMTIHAADMGMEIRISFTDTGLGVAPEDRDRIFDLFFQGKSH